MIAAYLDETGNTGQNLRDPSQRYHYVGALLVPEASWSALAADLKNIAVTAVRAKARDPRFEFHGHALFGRQWPWDGITSESKRLDIYEKCLELLERHDLRVVYGGCDKRKLTRYISPMHPHEVSFWLCLERLAVRLNSVASLGFIVADECGTNVKAIARKGLTDYRKNGPPFGRTVDVSRIVDTVNFIQSVESPHLQMCDLALWIIRRVRDTPDAGSRLTSLYEIVQSRVSGARTFPY